MKVCIYVPRLFDKISYRIRNELLGIYIVVVCGVFEEGNITLRLRLRRLTQLFGEVSGEIPNADREDDKGAVLPTNTAHFAFRIYMLTNLHTYICLLSKLADSLWNLVPLKSLVASSSADIKMLLKLNR